MTSYPKHCDCIVCGEPKAKLSYYAREDGRPVYVCEHCGAFFKLAKAGAAEVLARSTHSMKCRLSKTLAMIDYDTEKSLC